MVIAQEPTQSLAALHGPLTTNVCIPREQDIALPLVISLSVEMLDIFAQRPPQRALTEENHLGIVVIFFWQKARSVPISIGMDANLPSLDQLRNNAAECIRLAEAARTSEHKSFFIEMAERWLTLAERAEKTQAR
jgi:hypothetical protein